MFLGCFSFVSSSIDVRDEVSWSTSRFRLEDHFAVTKRAIYLPLSIHLTMESTISIPFQENLDLYEVWLTRPRFYNYKDLKYEGAGWISGDIFSSYQGLTIYNFRWEYPQYAFHGSRHSRARSSGRKTSKSSFSSFSSHSLVDTAGINTPKPLSMSSAWE